MMDEDNSVSLADLADLDVSDVAEIRFSSLPDGVFDFKVVEADLGEGLNRDQEKRFFGQFKFEVVDCIALIDKAESKEAMIGKNHSEKYYIVPSKPEEGIGLLRGAVADMGCENTGPLRPMIQGTIGHIFRAKIKGQKDKVDPSVRYARLVLEQKKG